MRKVDKFKALAVKRADAAADIDIINQYAVKELTPDDVFCFSVVLCDNDVDRELEAFTEASLDKMAELFAGTPMIRDHAWSAENQTARIYKLNVETAEGTTRDGRQLRQLVGCAYMVKNDHTQPTIDAIEAGILKEVSVGVRMGTCTCSICGEYMDWNGCRNGHQKGQDYDEGLCYGRLEDPLDAYEVSFVAVPAQPGAGVIKGMGDVGEAFGVLLSADLTGCPEEVEALLKHLQAARMSAEERAWRAEIAKKNQKYLKG